MKIDTAKLRVPSPKLDKSGGKSVVSPAVNVFTENRRGEFYYLNLDKLIPFKKQARRHFDEHTISSLADTIKEHGIRQPLTVVKSTVEEDKFEIVSGERRYLAAKMIGLDKVPCIIILDYSRAEEIALIENLQREDLNPVELGIAYKGLYDSGNYPTHSDIAEKLGVPRTQVTEYIKYADFSPVVRSLLIDNNIRERKLLRKVCSVADDMEREEYIRSEILKENNPDKQLQKIDLSRATLFNVILKNGRISSKTADLKGLGEREKAELRDHLLKILQSLG